MTYIDLRSDTVTKPTREMREAMFAAEVGDDVYGDDPTVNKLEGYAAEKVGKEAALFVPSGTFGNQLALFTHCTRGSEVILGEQCHIFQHEVGAASVIAGVQLRAVPGYVGQSGISQIETRIREEDIHEPDTGLICVENALSNGKVIPLDTMKELSAMAKRHNVPIHMDGARLFNAAAFLKTEAREIAGCCDSVMFCLSKGLCAPVGSMLAGSREFVARARKGRKLMGGGMRQAGILAAAGLIALERMTGRLGEDHENAVLLARGLASVPGIRIEPSDVQINMVFFQMTYPGLDMGRFAEGMKEKGILVNPGDNGYMRLVTHYWISREDIGRIVDALKTTLREMKLI